MAGKDTDPFGFSEGTRVALEQTHKAMDTYFDVLKESISAFPSGGTAIGDRWKEESLLNINAFQELVKTRLVVSKKRCEFRRHLCTHN